MTCQNCTHANREDTKMIANGYIRCAVADEKSQYKSVVWDCKDFKAIAWTEAQIKQHDRDAEMILTKMKELPENEI